MEYVKHSRAFIEKFVDKEYNEKTIKTQIERANHLERSSSLNKHNLQKKIKHLTVSDIDCLSVCLTMLWSWHLKGQGNNRRTLAYTKYQPIL